MKYLKFFESSFEEIKNSDDIQNNLNFEDEEFSQREIDIVNKYLESYNPKFKDGELSNHFNFIVSLSSNKASIKISELIKEHDDVVSKTYFYVYKVEDEWFILQNNRDNKFYKCDQIEGVVDCISLALEHNLTIANKTREKLRLQLYDN